jgi:glutamine synthetase
VRIPKYFSNNLNVRAEFRTPDPLCNPYLAFACIFEAGIDGIRNKIEPGDPVDKDVYHLTEVERKKLGIKVLPSSLKEALEALENDNVCKRALGEAAEKYLKLKWEEWKEYEKCNSGNPKEVTSWELEKYLFA